MDPDGWSRLSEWHNAWLSALPAERDRLQREFVSSNPALERDVVALVKTGPIAPGFLETPALALTLTELAAEDRPLPAGTRLGPYQVVELLARGGMGQVYRATDIRLGRDVAVKVLSGGSEHTPGAVEGFIQEARVTAALDRPNIVRLFDVGVHDGRPFLVMELLHGATLRHRLAGGPLPAADACRVALDVARGLVAAHAAGLIHHDLKPENIFLTAAGPAKILDFGVARLAPPTRPAAAETPTHLSATAGLLIGTAGYLAPEEMLGEPVDGRADLFALGAVVYEMLTGERAFGREHAIDSLYAVLHDPVPSLGGRPAIPDDLAAIVARLLEKSPDARFHSAADLAWTLERLEQPPSGVVAPALRASRRWLWALPAAAAAAAALIGGGLWLGTRSARRVPAPVTQFTWQIPDGLRLWSNPVVAPAGRRLAFVAGSRDVPRRLFVRDLSSLTARVIAGTEEARQPFWSPDGSHLGYFSGGRLFAVAVDGGAPIPLADAPDPRGGSWNRAGQILFSPNYRDSALLIVSSSGGPARVATRFDIGADDTGHRWPSFLPDGRHFLYQVVSIDDRQSGVYVASLDDAGASATRLFPSESGAVYVEAAGEPTGTLLTARDGRVEARGFDARTQRLIGDVRRLPVTAARATPHEPAMLDASADVLALAASSVPWGSHLVSMPATGTAAEILTAPELGGWPRLSRDGVRLVRSWVDPDRGNPDLWVRDLQRGTELRITTSRDFDVSPVWSPGGDRIAYRSGALDAPRLAIVSADGTTHESRACPGKLCEPTDWASDGRMLLNVDGDIWVLAADSAQPPAALLHARYVERDGRFSPDGRWVAYVSEDAGRPEVSIQSLSGPARRVIVSNAGGDQPVWKGDGTALFYVDHEQRLQRVSVALAPDSGVVLGRPVPVGVPQFNQGHWGTTYEITPDGARVLLPRPPDARPPAEMTIVLGWRALLR